MKFRKVETGFIEPDMTPMIDVVFQLLTFFMIAINFENTKSDERIKLPRDMLARPPAVKPEHELVLNFGYPQNASGGGARRGPMVLYNEHYVDVREIGPDLDTERRVMERIHGSGVLRDVTVLIRADAEVPAGQVQELIRKCQEAGFSKFSLRALAEEI